MCEVSIFPFPHKSIDPWLSSHFRDTEEEEEEEDTEEKKRKSSQVRLVVHYRLQDELREEARLNEPFIMLLILAILVAGAGLLMQFVAPLCLNQMRMDSFDGCLSVRRENASFNLRRTMRRKRLKL